mmetsp:Transcript_22560/g.19553  ORF Transcript_22560/g.19553 Transcript_22560/m.19553 type:complete len:102 (+) Transcript_22560:5072-5377(+)
MNPSLIIEKPESKQNVEHQTPQTINSKTSLASPIGLYHQLRKNRAQGTLNDILENVETTQKSSAITISPLLKDDLNTKKDLEEESTPEKPHRHKKKKKSKK